MSGGRALGRLGVADRRPADQSLASQTLGQDSGEKAQRRDVGLEGRRAHFFSGGYRAAWTMALGHALTPWGLEGWATGLPYPTDSLFPPLARSRTSLEPVPYTAKRGEGQGPPTLQH